MLGELMTGAAVEEPRFQGRGDGAAWLAEALRSGRQLLWTGHGASFALALALAEVLEERGASSQALPASRVRGRETCVVSQSARDLGVRTVLLVTESERVPSWTSAPRLEVPGGKGEPPEWLPLSFLRRALETARAALALPPWSRPAPPVLAPGSEVIVLARQAGPLRALVDAARGKLEELPLHGLAYDELGHGLHARLWRQPAAYQVLLLRGGGDEAGQWEAILRWCAEAGVATQELLLGSSASAGTGPLEVLDQGLVLIETLCAVRRIDWRTSRLPEGSDWLRNIPTDPRARSGTRGSES